ncbi:MAG: hypothetical protein R2725_07700 [Solirubrobacterales bacterium]
MLPETLAKRSTRCPLCRERIRGGEHYIAKVRPGWAHASCAHAYRAAMAENEEAA